MATSPEFPTNQSDTVSSAELADFVFHSFYFSQGSQELQRTILDYGRWYYRENLPKTPELYSETRNLVEARSIVWVKGTHTQVSADAVGTQATKHVDTLFKISHGIRPRAIDRAIDGTLARGTVARDYRWLLTENAVRPNRDPQKTNEYNDPFLSFAVHYGILGNTTRRPLYDQIFQRVGDAIVRLYGSDESHLIQTDIGEYSEFVDALDTVATAHCLHHPEQASRVTTILQTHRP